MYSPSHSLLFLLLVSQLEALGQFIQVLAVVQLHFGAAPKVILQLGHHSHLRLHAYVQTSQLFAQLHTNICRTNKQTELQYKASQRSAERMFSSATQMDVDSVLHGHLKYRDNRGIVDAS